MISADLGRSALAIAIGWVLGSVLPAELLARLRGMDIRTVGDGNPGTVNAVRGLGWGLGLLTAAYDISIGVVALLIARRLGVGSSWAYVAGIAAVVGHRFPIFSGFRRGGQGMAASAGLLVYGLAIGISRGWVHVVDVAVLLAILLVAFLATRSDSTAAAVMLPFFIGRVAFSGADLAWVLFELVVASYIWAVQLGRVRQRVAARRSGEARGRHRDAQG